VTRHGRLLLVRRAHEPWRGTWDVPGGFCGPREHPADAAVREVKEETGLDIRTTGILGLWIDTYAPSGPDADKVTLNVYFHATPTSAAEARLDPNEAEEIGWYAPGELPSALAFPGHIPKVLRAWRRAVEEQSPTAPVLDPPSSVAASGN
jgi:ADP-ribose pyrophosphatase YjhB (NUDIX family)